MVAEPSHRPRQCLAVGLRDDRTGLSSLNAQFFDKKPDFFAFAGDLNKTTQAEFLASVGASPEE